MLVHVCVLCWIEMDGCLAHNRMQTWKRRWVTLDEFGVLRYYKPPSGVEDVTVEQAWFWTPKGEIFIKYSCCSAMFRIYLI